MEHTATLLSLMAFPDIDPVIFSLGPVQVRWYGLAYVTGILLGWRYARRLVENRRLWPEGGSHISALDIDDFLIWATVGIVAGGRIGYILFYDFAAVSANPLRAFEIWNGGMSFHGGLLGTLAAMILFARSRAIPLFSLFDVVCAVVPFGLFFGRLANFINSELWGKLTDAPWAVVFPTGGPFPRHPTQLYEAGLEGLLLLAVTALAVRAGGFRRPGLVAGVFGVGYGLARIVSEFFREPDPQLEALAHGLTMGMVLSAPMIVIGLWLIVRGGRAEEARR